jgi:hypothetical protein
MLLGALGAFQVRYETIRPVDWKRALNIKMSKGLTDAQRKELSRRRASELFPAERERWGLQKQHGLAEAALIAEAVRRRSMT